MNCPVCGKKGRSRFGLMPGGWFAMGSATGPVVCSTTCAGRLFAEQKQQEAEAWLDSFSDATTASSGSA